MSPLVRFSRCARAGVINAALSQTNFVIGFGQFLQPAVVGKSPIIDGGSGRKVISKPVSALLATAETSKRRNETFFSGKVSSGNQTIVQCLPPMLFKILRRIFCDCQKSWTIS